MDRSDNFYRVYEPQILQTMGTAFDTVWDVLPEDYKNREGARQKLALLIIRLVDEGEADPLRLCKSALDMITPPDAQLGQKKTHSNLALRVGMPCFCSPANDRNMPGTDITLAALIAS